MLRWPSIKVGWRFRHLGSGSDSWVECSDSSFEHWIVVFKVERVALKVTIVGLGVEIIEYGNALVEWD